MMAGFIIQNAMKYKYNLMHKISFTRYAYRFLDIKLSKLFSVSCTKTLKYACTSNCYFHTLTSLWIRSIVVYRIFTDFHGCS